MNWNIIGAGLYLTAASVCDLRTREIPKKLIAGFGIMAGIWLMVTTEKGNYLLGMLPGLFALLLGYLTRESIGYGDGFSILLSGLFLGLRAAVFVVLWALFFSCVYAGTALVSGKAKRHGRFAFVPFLMLAFACLVLCIRGKG